MFNPEVPSEWHNYFNENHSKVSKFLYNNYARSKEYTEMIYNKILEIFSFHLHGKRTEIESKCYRIQKELHDNEDTLENNIGKASWAYCS